MKAVIAAGGFATRFLPVSKAIPKEFLPIDGKPVIHHQLWMLYRSGIREVIIVVRRHVDLIRNYLERDEMLDRHIGRYKADLLFNELDIMRKEMQIAFVSELETWPYGDAEALLAARPWLCDEPFYCLWVDDLVFGEPTVFEQLAAAFTGHTVTAGVDISPDESLHYGSFSSGEDGRVLSIYSAKERDDGLAHIGHTIFTTDIFGAIDAILPAHSGELWIGDAMRVLIENDDLYYCEIDGLFLSAGDIQRMLMSNMTVLNERRWTR